MKSKKQTETLRVCIYHFLLIKKKFAFIKAGTVGTSIL
jgi:hypothetical protein